jgi:hypothetical protein
MQKPSIIRVSIKARDDGWLTATSPDLPGLFLAHQELKVILAEAPSAIEILFKAQNNVDVTVIAAHYPAQDEDNTMPWVAFPTPLAGKELAIA